MITSVLTVLRMVPNLHVEYIGICLSDWHTYPTELDVARELHELHIAPAHAKFRAGTVERVGVEQVELGEAELPPVRYGFHVVMDLEIPQSTLSAVTQLTQEGGGKTEVLRQKLKAEQTGKKDGKTETLRQFMKRIDKKK